MSTKLRNITRVVSEQTWIDPYQDDDPCLFDELVAAYVARGHAERSGATASQLARGDDALAQIRDGRAKGTDAWHSAKTALRRFSEVYGSLTLRPSRRGRALQKRYGRRREKIEKRAP